MDRGSSFSNVDHEYCVTHFLVISPEMTHKTGQMSVRPYGVNVFKTQRLRDRWADVDETRHVFSTGLGTKLLWSGIFNFGPCAARSHPERRQDMTHPNGGAYSCMNQVLIKVGYILTCNISIRIFRRLGFHQTQTGARISPRSPLKGTPWVGGQKGEEEFDPHFHKPSAAYEQHTSNCQQSLPRLRDATCIKLELDVARFWRNPWDDPPSAAPIHVD